MASASPKKDNAKTTDVAIPRFSDDDLSSIESWDDALALLEREGATVESADEVLGNGFTVIKDKGVLVGVPFLALEWHFNDGDMGEFVSVSLLAKMPGQKTPAKLVINDGSHGIYRDLLNYTTKTGKTRGLMVKNGLTRSDYTYEDEQTGEKRAASTFYLDTSAS